MKKYILRADNHSQEVQKEYDEIARWCAMYEIPIKYIGKSKRGRCHWLQIEVGLFFTNFLLSNMPEIWQKYKEKN